MAEAAKIERATAKRLFTMAVKALNKAISDQQANEVVNERFATVQQRCKSVTEKHAYYLAYAYPDETSAVSESDEHWLDVTINEFDQVEQEYEKYVKLVTQNNTSEDDNLRKIHRLVKYEQATLQTSINCVHDVLADPDSSRIVIADAQAEMKQQLERYRTIQRDYVTLLSDDNDMNEELKICQNLQSLCIKANITVGTAIERKTEEPAKKMTELKLERMKMPSFDGDIRNYPRFKNDFEKQVKPSIRSESTAYVLKSCLSKEPLEIVKNVDDDISEMWLRLDDRYGRLSKLTDAIMFDINQLKSVPEGEGSKFIDLVNVIERSYRDLMRINMQGEISNSTIVGLIEQKLPPSIKNMWCLEVSDKNTTVDERDKFPPLLEFLLKHRRAIEYSSNDLRTKKSVRIESAINHVKEETSNDSEPLPQKSESRQDDDGCWIHETNGHTIYDCRAYLRAAPVERWDLVNEYRACRCCLKIGHRSFNCYNHKECNKDGCKGIHHPTLHEQMSNKHKSQEENLNHITESEENDTYGSICLLQLMQVPAGERISINIMWDSGATISMITFKKAKELGLTGTKTNLTIVKIGCEREIVKSKAFNVPVYDTHGNVEYFKAYGIEKISTTIDSTDTGCFANLLNIDAAEIKRPTGEIDMLIGFEYAAFHPEKERAHKHLLLLRNKFGRCIGGSHQWLEERTQLLVQEACVNHASIKIDDFYNSEALGVSCQPRCGGCRCGECPIGGKQYTLQQERELAMIENGLELKDGKWIAHYPWKRDPHELPNNYSAALAMLKSTEKRLKKNESHAALYNEQIEDMLQRGVARKLTEYELKAYAGPVFYVSHHDVMKPESISTPCRIVFNSSAKFLNHTLNDYWVKGPDLLNNMLGILLRFRENKVAVAGDVRKMYHSVNISEVDQHTHRFLWRGMDENKKPDVYMMMAVSFGDKPAGAIASLALRKTAEYSLTEYPVASKMIIKNTYVDDVIDSFNSIQEADQVTEDADTILEKGGFTMKGWIKSSPTSGTAQPIVLPMDENKEASKVLGVVWNSCLDILEFKVKLNFSPKKRNQRTEVDLTSNDLLSSIPTVLTRRMILSQVNGIYDPIGLASPFTVQAKIMLRSLTAEGLDWDEAVSDSERQKWVKFFQDVFEMEDISFPRSIKPNDAVGQPVLILFSDASEHAFGTCAYVRWRMSNGTFQSRLLTAKSRLAPLKKITMPRLELNAALLSARLKSFIVEEMSDNFSRFYYIVDSEIARAMIQKESYGFKTFSGVRVGEIQSKTKKEDWFWVESALNIADIITRGARPEDLGMESEWQKGPKFLCDPENEWPIKQTYTGASLPDQIVMKIEVLPSSIAPEMIDLQRFSSYDKLVHVTARVKSSFSMLPRSLKNIAKSPDRKSLADAERTLIIIAQGTLSNDIKPDTMKRLGVKEIDGIKVVGSRLEDWNSITYNDSNPVLLSAKCRLAVLYAQQIHDKCHLGISAVVAMIRSKYWIVGLRQLVKSIRFKCVVCRRLHGKVEQQVMGQLPTERLKPAPAWSYTSVDLFGPFYIKGETNKRTKGKGYGVIFDCLLSRAVHVDVATDYSTDSFLLVVRRFISLRGCPVRMWSDQGTQLKAANKEIQQIISGHDQNLMIEFGIKHTFDWSFSTPEAPWQNGCAEILVKAVKKAIEISMGNQVLTYTETQTVFFESADLVNERPIGRHPTSVEDGSYLAPNNLLLGRSTNKISTGPFSPNSCPYARFRLVQQIVNTFWKRWTRDFFPSLIVQQKWHVKTRPVKVGDIVIIADKDLKRGKWKLAKVTAANESLRDGFVRNVEVQYKNPDSNSFTTVQRPVQKLVVLVAVDSDNE